MASSKRIKGAALFLEIDETSHDCDVTAATITNEEGEDDVVTFCDVAAGDDRDFKLNLTAIQSTDPDSLWSYIWENSGEIVPYTYAPHGNAEPSESQPHFVGTVEIGPPPEIGGEAGKDNTFTFETEWDCQEKPTIDRGEED